MPDSHIIITGGAAGIGEAAARRLGRSGARLSLLDVDGERLLQTRDALQRAQIDCAVWVVDVARRDAVETAIAQAVARSGAARVVVANAGTGFQKPFLQTTPAELRQLLAINLEGAFHTLQVGARQMIESGLRDGRLISIASVAGLRGSMARSAYGASKAAVINLTQVIAVELAEHGITANCIAPGPVETDLTRRMHTPASRTAWKASVPQRRYGSADEVAAAVAFLAARDSSFVTGEVLTVDGGWSAAGLLF